MERPLCKHEECRVKALERLWWLAPLLGYRGAMERIQEIPKEEVPCYADGQERTRSTSTP